MFFLLQGTYEFQLDQIFLINGYHVSLIFRLHTPELLLYWLENPLVKELVTNRYNYKLNSASSKNSILSTLYKTRPKSKTHGFEKLLDFNQEVYKELGRTQIKRLESSIDGIPYDTVIQQLKGLL